MTTSTPNPAVSYQTARNGAGIYLIDAPSPFASLEEWQGFLASMERLNAQDSPEVCDALAEARQMILKLQNGSM